MRVRVKDHCSWYHGPSGVCYAGGTSFEIDNDLLKAHHTRQLEVVKPGDKNRNSDADVALFSGLVKEWAEIEHKAHVDHVNRVNEGRDMSKINEGLRARIAQLERERELVGVGVDDDPIGGQDRAERSGKKR